MIVVYNLVIIYFITIFLWKIKTILNVDSAEKKSNLQLRNVNIVENF